MARHQGDAVTEKELDVIVKDACDMFRWKRYHTFISYKSPAGFPDLVLVRERVIYAELKGPTTKVTPKQIEWLDALHEAGQETYLWRPENVQEIVDVLRSEGTPSPLPEPVWRGQKNLRGSSNQPGNEMVATREQTSQEHYR